MSKDYSKKEKNYFVHPTAIIEDNVEIGVGTKIWHFAQIRKDAKIGKNCVIGNSVFIDETSIIGDNCKIQNHAIIYHQAIIENGVFIGPNVCFTNDQMPRAVNPNGSIKGDSDWKALVIYIGTGSAIGGHSVITPGVTIGKWVIVGAGSVITRDVPDFTLIYGNPARIRGFVCKCGEKLKNIIKKDRENVIFVCECGQVIIIPRKTYKLKRK